MDTWPKEVVKRRRILGTGFLLGAILILALGHYLTSIDFVRPGLLIDSYFIWSTLVIYIVSVISTLVIVNALNKKKEG